MRFIGSLIFSISMICFSGLAYSMDDFIENTRFSLRTETGITYYGIDLGDKSDPVSTATTGVYGDVTVGGSAYYLDRYSVDAYARFPITSFKDIRYDNDTGKRIYQSVSIERFEYGGSFNIQPFTAYRSWIRNVNFYAGYKYLDTNAEELGDASAWKFTAQGPTFGMGYLWRSDNFKHTFSVQGGLAYLFGQFAVKFINDSSTRFKRTGDADALAYTAAIRYKYNITTRLGVSLRIDAYYTDFGKINLGSIPFSTGLVNLKLPFEEYTVSGRLGVSYLF